MRVCPTNAAGESACLGGRGEIDGSGNVSYCRNGTAGPLCSLCVNVGDYLDEETSTYAALGVEPRTKALVRPMQLCSSHAWASPTTGACRAAVTTTPSCTHFP